MSGSVLMVMAQFPPAFIGGAEKMAETFARAFIERGILYRVVTRRSGTTSRGSNSGLPLDVLSYPDVCFLGSCAYLLKLGLYLFRHRHNYDIIYLGLPKYNTILCALVAAALRKALVVKFESPTWERQESPTHRIRFFGLFLKALRRADAVVVLNRAMREDLLERGISPDRVVVIPNAVDTRRFSPAVDRAATRAEQGVGDGCVIVYLGRLMRAKGVHVLLRAFTLLARHQRSCRLMLIGDGPEQEELIRSARERGIADRVTVGGLEDPAPVLGSCDLFVLPSESEGVSCAMLEAMASGLCVVATPVGGNREVMTNNETGLFVPVGDAPRLAATLLDLITDSRKRTRLAETGRAHVCANYSLSRLSSRYEQLFADIFHPRPAASCLPKVLQVITTSEFGGAQDVVLNICRATEDQYDTVVVTSPGGVLVDQLQERGVCVRTVPIEANNDPLVIWKLRSIIQEIEPALVHAHDARASFVATLAARLAGSPPVIYHVHLFNHWRARRGLMRLLDAVPCRLAAGIVTCSEHLRHYLAEAQGIGLRTLTAVPNCVDTEKFAPLRASGETLHTLFPDDAFVLLCCARLTANKGIAHLLRALALPGPTHGRACLVLAGDGELRDELAALARELGIAERVHFAGYLSDVRTALADCDAYVQPSLVEGLPIAVLEAMSMGCPVIATAISGTPEIVRHECTGLCVAAADPDALGVAIDRFIEHPDEREAMADRGRDLVQREYSLGRLSERLHALYTGILEGEAT